MLTAMKLKNFQKHKSLTIQFSQVSTILGATDKGKSAIIRALRWILLNQPRGDKFIRHGASNCSVSVFIDDHLLKRSKGKSNVYKLDDQVFKSFGNSVPDTIAAIVNVSELNFQKQHDPTFWLSLSSAEVGRQLNAIVDMELMDRVLRHVLNDERKIKSQIEYEAERITELRSHVKSLRWVPAAESAFASVLALRAGVDSCRIQQARLRSLADTLAKHQADILRAETATVEADRIAAIGQECRTLKKDIKRLKEMVSKLNELESLPDPKMITEWKAVQKKKPSLTAAESLEEMIGNFTRYEKEIDECQKNLKRLLDLQKSRSAICPKCGQVIRTGN